MSKFLEDTTRWDMKRIALMMILILMVVALAGCGEIELAGCGEIETYDAQAKTVTEIDADCKAEDYRTDDFYSNDYLILVLVTTENADKLELSTDGEYNFMLWMMDGEVLQKMIRPIDELFGMDEHPAESIFDNDIYEYALVFYTNYTLEERDYTLCITKANGESETIELTEYEE